MKKPVKSMASSPSVNPLEGKLTSGGAKYSTGSGGRAYPAGLDSVKKGSGNPRGVKK